MKKMRWLYILFGLFLITIRQPAMAQDERLTQQPEIADKIHLVETWLQAQLDYHRLPGLSVALVYDQQLLWARGFGYADIEQKIPASPQTVYRIASITKLFTCTAIVQLRDQGRLQLDDPVEKYLPWFRIQQRFPNAAPITIRQLMTHTSGLPREAAFPYWTDHQFPTREQLIEKLPQQETIYPPATKWKYSNLGMALLGEIVVAVSGQDYESYVQNQILTPLQMTSTSVNLTTDQKKRLAAGYGRRLPDGSRKLMPFTAARGLTPAANMSSTVEDLARFASFQFQEQDGGRGSVLKRSSVLEMQRVQWLQPSWQRGWGLGFSISHRNEKTFIGHGGWVAGYRTQLLLCPAEKIAVIVMCNAEDVSPAFLANHIFDVLAPAIGRALAKPAPIPEWNPDWKKYLGRYADPTDWEYEVMILNDQLVLYGYDYPPEENPTENVIELTPERAHTFRMIGDNGDGELVIFEMGADGKVSRVKKGENYLYPVR